MISTGMVFGVTCGEWNWMWVRLKLWWSPGHAHNSSPVNPINSGWNCTERDCWPCYIGCYVWCLDDFVKYLRSVSRAAAHMLGILRKSWQVFHDWLLLLRSCWSFVLPVLEYCSAVWCSAANSYLKQLDRVVRSAFFSWWCFGVQLCPSTICSSVVHAI